MTGVLAHGVWLGCAILALHRGVPMFAYALMWKLIGRMDAIRVASLFYLSPPVHMLVSWFAFGDALTASDLAGLIVVSVGVMLVQGEGRENRLP